MRSKSDVKNLYSKYGDKMCLAPFLNSFYSTTNVVGLDQDSVNTVRPCSLITGNWAVEHNSISLTRNNDRWKQLRQAFLDGRMDQMECCNTCIKAERQGSSSPRTLNNEYLFEHLELDIVAEIEKIVQADLESHSVYALDYMPSNYCNYACVMCYSGASSQRFVFEIKNGAKLKNIVNPVDQDFFDLLKNIKILGFTGGETIMQPEVHTLLDYLIEKEFAKDMIITILTNASDFPDSLEQKLRHFKRVLYTVSVDGVGAVIEYQRRGCVWDQMEKNAIKIHHSPVVHEIINHVSTAINILSAMDFVDWCHHNDLKFIAISAVFQHDSLGVAAMPPELAQLALARLRAGRQRYEKYLGSQYVNHERNWVDTIDRLINILENTTFSPESLERFIKKIRMEDVASRRPLREVVPEWAPWFD